MNLITDKKIQLLEFLLPRSGESRINLRFEPYRWNINNPLISICHRRVNFRKWTTVVYGCITLEQIIGRGLIELFAHGSSGCPRLLVYTEASVVVVSYGNEGKLEIYYDELWADGGGTLSSSEWIFISFHWSEIKWICLELLLCNFFFMNELNETL